MPPEDLLEAVRRRPFVPFRLCLTDGQSYEIRHPELVLPGRRTTTVGLPSDADVPLYEHTVVVDLIHIVRLEPIDGQIQRQPR